MSERDPWLTEKEAAKELRISVAVLRAERAAGRLSFHPIRKRAFYAMSDIEAYKANIRCPAKSSFGNTPQRADTTSPGLSAPDRSAVQRAKEISARLSKSSQPSSLSRVVALRPSQTKSA